jgi:hypothetical protein
MGPSFFLVFTSHAQFGCATAYARTARLRYGKPKGVCIPSLVDSTIIVSSMALHESSDNQIVFAVLQFVHRVVQVTMSGEISASVMHVCKSQESRSPGVRAAHAVRSDVRINGSAVLQFCLALGARVQNSGQSRRRT